MQLVGLESKSESEEVVRLVDENGKILR